MKGILTYHSIDPSGSPISLDAAAFRRHVEWLASGAVAVRSLAALTEVTDPGQVLAVTFDDGFVNFRDVAWPLLRAHGIPVTLFVVTDRAGGDNAWGGAPGLAIPTLPLLDWEALGRLAEEGVEIGSHTRSHPDLRTVAPDRLADEIGGAAERIRAEIGRPATSFAYPYGHHDDRVVAVAREHHALACTVELRCLASRDDLHRLPRLDAYYFRGGDRLAAWGTRRLRAYLALRGVGRSLRRRLAGLGS